MNKDLLKFMEGLKNQVDKNILAMKADNLNLRKEMKEEISTLMKKVENAKIEAVEKENNDKLAMFEVNKKLGEIENMVKFTKNACERNKKEATEQEERVAAFKRSTGLDKPATPTAGNQPPVQPATQKTWSKVVQITKIKPSNSTVDQAAASEVIGTAEKDDEKKVMKSKLKHDLKMGDSLHSSDDWSWDESDDQRDRTADRERKNKEKKREMYLKRKEKKKKTARKAKHMLSIGPIKKESVDYFFNVTADYELAKEMAVKEWLTNYLQLGEDDLKDFEVAETMLSANREDNIIYVTFLDYESIRELHRRVAQIQNDKIQTRNYVPPQFWEQYNFLSKFCASKRAEEPPMKTLMRFSDVDIEILMKPRGSPEPYVVVPLEEIEKIAPILKYDHSVTWKKCIDRPPRQPVSNVRTVCPPSIRGVDMQRQLSSSSSNLSSGNPTKKLRTSAGDPAEQMEMQCDTEEESL